MAESTGRIRGALLFAGGLLITLGAVQGGLLTALSPGTDLDARVWRQIGLVVLALALLLWIGFVERKPLSSIGLRAPGWSTVGWGLLGALALIASFMICYALILPALGLSQDREGAARIVANPLWFQALIITVAATTEEIVYRGYIIERVQSLSDSRWLAFAVSVVAFTAAHAGAWSPSQLIVVVFGAIIMGLLYLWKRDLILVMIAHWVADAVGFGLANLAAQAAR